MITTVTPPQSKLEDALRPRVRLIILKLLMESQALTTSEIASKLGVNYDVARGHLDALENSGVLGHANFGERIRSYRFKQSAKAKAVRNFIEAWYCPENHV